MIFLRIKLYLLHLRKDDLLCNNVIRRIQYFPSIPGRDNKYGSSYVGRHHLFFGEKRLFDEIVYKLV